MEKPATLIFDIKWWQIAIPELILQPSFVAVLVFFPRQFGYGILTNSYNGIFPSKQFPVMMEARYGKQAKYRYKQLICTPV